MTNTPPSARGAGLRALLVPALALLCWCCSDAPSAEEELLARARAAALFHKDKMSAAREALAPLVAAQEASLDVLCDAASIEFALGAGEAADALLDRAAALDADSPRVTFLRGQLLRGRGEFREALPLFEATARSAPDDLPTLLCLADVQYGLDRVDEAVATLERVLAVGPENGAPWYYSAAYRMSRILVEEGSDEADAWFDRIEALDARGFEPPTDTQLNRGTLAIARSPEPAGNEEREPTDALEYEAAGVVLPELAGAEELSAVDLDGDGRRDLLARASSGVHAGFRDADGWSAVTISGDTAAAVVPFDMDNDGDRDLLLVASGGLRLLRADARAFAPADDVPLPELPGVATCALAVDLDHEGDLDLVVGGAFGLRVWRNDGVASEEGGRFTEIETPGLALTEPVAAVLAEDLDVDQDVDLLVTLAAAGAGRHRVYGSLRGGNFERVAESHALRAVGDSVAGRLVLADLDGDGVPEAVAADAARIADLDLDGLADLLTGHAARVATARLGAGSGSERAIELPEVGAHAADAFAVLDVDADGAPDLACATAEGVALFRAAARKHPSLLLQLRGVRDNRFAVGAVVELRSGPRYRRLFWDGEPTLVGMGSARIDVLRIVWPNGVLQEDLDLDLVARTSLETEAPETFGTYEQAAGLVGSCPFLYTWNGETYAFVSDVLGITPLGLPMAPGMLVPPDHDEYVLVRGDQLRAKDGVLSLQITEELREVTYLDRVRLHAIDHAPDVAIYPDERFTFPPFPPPHTHTVRAPVAATRVTGSDGADWTAAVGTLDDVHAVPFATYDQQFMGLATPHFLEYAFDPADLAGAEKLRLVMTGWLFWTNASINLASARHEGIAFVPPILQVPDGEGGWRDAGPPVGFPAGKTKTMVLDVSDLLDREDPRLRVFSTLQLYWDRVVLAVDGDDAPLVEHVLEPAGATLWDRGFSRPFESERADLPERFEWDELAPRPRWDPHPGAYTRYGEVLELLTEVDDRFCILATGDALEVRFDASALPPPREGLVRDYLVFLDGWAKDRDPNTIAAETVEPLPFHGMSGYPYGADESFPEDEAHRRWRAEWNTREARRRIRPLAPSAEGRWLRDAR